jgi:hypothetical protein
VFNNLVLFVEELLDSADELIATNLLFNVEHSILKFDLSKMDDLSNHNAGHYFLFNKTDGTRNACR